MIDIVDQGPGMTPEFIRDDLFQPFASTKSGGHGIGAFQARELLRDAGGDLLVIEPAKGRHNDAAAAARGTRRASPEACRCRPERVAWHGQTQAADRRG